MEHKVGKQELHKDVTLLNNRKAIQELKTDKRRIKQLTVISLMVSVLTYRLGVCFNESLVCLSLAIIGLVFSQLFLKV